VRAVVTALAAGADELVLSRMRLQRIDTQLTASALAAAIGSWASTTWFSAAPSADTNAGQVGT